MKPPMLHTAYLVTTTRSAYGGYTSSGDTALTCHFRYITNLTNEKMETTDSDAMAWFEPDSGVEQGSIIAFEGVHWKVERITFARKLRDPSVQFIKTELKKYGRIS